MTVSRGQLIASGGSVALSAALAACGSNTGRGDGSSGSQGAALQQWYHQYGEAGTEQAVKRYAAAYRKAKVTVQWHLDELVDAARALTTKDVKGLFLGNDGGAGVLGGTPLQAAGLHLVADDGRVGFDDPQAARTLGKLRRRTPRGWTGSATGVRAGGSSSPPRGRSSRPSARSSSSGRGIPSPGRWSFGQDREAWTVQVALSTFTTAQTVNLHELFVAAAVSVLPLLLVFLTLQRFIVAGVERTGIDD